MWPHVPLKDRHVPGTRTMMRKGHTYKKVNCSDS